jgi:hypothetical protein
MDFSVRVGYPYYVNVESDTPWPGGSGLKSTRQKEGTVMDMNYSPHLVYGKINYDNAFLTEGDINYHAYFISKPDEKVNQTAPGCMIKEDYWVLQCHAFPSGWKAGETLKVIFTDKKGLMLGETEVLLTNDPADEANEIIFGEKISELLLLENKPNPFTDYTLIQYQILDDERIDLGIYSISGQRVRTLVNEFKSAGFYEVIWDGKDNQGNDLSEGIYIYILKSKSTQLMKKSVLIR